MNKKDLLTAYPNYVKLFSQIDREIQRTPNWRILRHYILLNRLHRLNTNYERWFNEYLSKTKEQS